MTLQDRADAYATAYPQWPASHLRVVTEKGRQVLYGIWVIGNDYRNRSKYYGSYPPGYLNRVMALFPDARGSVLHVFSGSLQPGDYTRLDLKAEADIRGSVYEAMMLVQGQCRLICADPPYTRTDAEQYGTPPVDRGRATRALAAVAERGGHMAWLDTCWPMHSKRQWLTVGRIFVQRSTNHRVRLLTLFERTT